MTDSSSKDIKPLGQKAYGSIGHLPGSRMGPADHHVHPGQGNICCVKTRDKHDLVIVQEKLDGSCCSVARVGDEIVPLGRAGYKAITSPFEQHHLFHDWAMDRSHIFLKILSPGERIVGEWLAQAHGTRYNLWHCPFVAFDIMEKSKRKTVSEVRDICTLHGIITPMIIHNDHGPLSIEAALAGIALSGHGAIGHVEGAVWRVERKGVVDFLAKYVRPDKIDGCYLPNVSGNPEVWNWRP